MGHILWVLFGPQTWGAGGNLAAWVICGALGAAGACLFRDLIGRHLAAWFHKHHAVHSRADLAAMEERLKSHIDARHQELADRAASKGRQS